MRTLCGSLAFVILWGGAAFSWSEELRPAWREDVRFLQAGTFPVPPEELTMDYVFGWSGIVAARARAVLRRGENNTWEGNLVGGTRGWARSLWKLDAEYATKMAARDWTSLSMRLVQNYRAYRTDEKAEFLPGGVRAWRESSKAGAKPAKWRNFHVEGIRDIGAAVLLARSQPLRDGDVLRLAVYPGEWMYLVTVRVEKRETIPWHGSERKVIRASLGIETIGRDYSLSPHRKFQRGTVWVSDDELRVPLRVEVRVFIGHVFAELQNVSSQ